MAREISASPLDSGTMFYIKDDGELLGEAITSMGVDELLIHRMFVFGPRRQKIGTVLLKFIEERGKALEAKKVVIIYDKPLVDFPHEAELFLEKMGYQLDPESDDFIKNLV